MTLKKYTLKVKQPEHWQEIHDTLCGISSCQHIPDREVSCTDEKEHSPTRGTFSLHKYEAEELKKHPHIDWIELCPICNPDSYPKPDFATKRFKKSVKFYRDLGSGSNIPPSTNPTSVELDRSNWGVARTGVKRSVDFFPDTVSDVDFVSGDVSYTLTGKNVDIVIHDSGVLQYHPEFMDGNGQSRVRDIILDGPFYIDPEYFITNGYTTTRADGRITGSEAESKGWWANSANRSPQFQSEGTIFVSSSYTENNALGATLDGSNGMTSGHGTSCASLAAGKNFGVAFEANIWNMPGIGDAVGMGIETNYDAMKIWHRNKPINPETGIKNPTIVNGSWGYQAAFGSGDTVTYKFRGSTGTTPASAAAVAQSVTAMIQGLNNQIFGAYKSWSSSSRSNSTDTAANEFMLTGPIYVAAAGNNDQRLGIGADDPDRLNYMSDNYFATTDPRSEFPTGTVPCNHRDWMNPQGIGFDASKDFHPVVCVGAIEDSMVNGVEYKASYSNNGPGIDIWSPADETLAAGTNGVSGYTDYQRYDDSRFYDNNFNGTSAAAPVATGVIALYLQANPKATSRDVKNWLKDHGSVLMQANPNTSGNGYYYPYPDDTNVLYWTDNFNLRGAEPRVVYNPYANDEKPSMEGIDLDGLSLTQS